MSARDLLHDMLAAGFTLDVADGKLLVTPASKLTDDLREALRASKPELLALLGDDRSGVVDQVHHPAVGGTCTDCLHLLAGGTCAEPVAAGLLTAEEGFGIVWPPEGHGAGCAGYSGKTPAKAPARPYRLKKDGADAAHAEPWGDAAIARFQSRMQRFAGLGIGEQDADDLAERLHLRDLDDNDRHVCLECDHYRPGRCGNHRRAGLQAPDVGRDLALMLQQCAGQQSST